MTTAQKVVVSTLGACAVLGALAFFNWTPFRTVVQSVTNLGSAVGATFNSAKIAEVIIAPATGSATSSAILNSDASDRIIESATYNCSGVGTSFTAYTGAGLQALTLRAATSTSASVIPSGTNLVMGATVATSTPNQYEASTTPGLTSTVANRIWAANSNLVFFFNATNTASCEVKVNYMGS